jgi:hypothetical protein
VFAAGVAAVLLRRDFVSVPAAPVAACVLAAVLAGVWIESRGGRRPPPVTSAVLQPINAWAQHVHRARIAIDGFFVQYPLYGADLSNRVQYLGARRPHGGFAELPTCRAWWTAIERGRYRYVALGSSTTSTASLEDAGRPALVASWMAGDAGARPVLHQDGLWLFEVHPELGRPARCGGAS